MEKMLVRPLINKKYHCSFCERYPDLVIKNIKKIYIFDDLVDQDGDLSPYIGYYQCIDQDTVYP